MSHLRKIVHGLVCAWAYGVFVLFGQLGAQEAKKLVQPVDLNSLAPEAIQRFPIDDPRLAYVYVEAIRGGFSKPPSWLIAAQDDIKRRGNEATDLLLRLFDLNPEQVFRGELLLRIDEFPPVPVQPFVEKARRLWKSEAYQLDRSTCCSIAWILSRHGSPADLSVLNEMKLHPNQEIGSLIQSDLIRMQKRLDGTLKQSEWFDVYGRPPPGYNWQPKAIAPQTEPPRNVKPLTPPNAQQSTPEAVENKSMSTRDEQPASAPRLAWAMMLATATGLLWVLLKRRAK